MSCLIRAVDSEFILLGRVQESVTGLILVEPAYLFNTECLTWGQPEITCKPVYLGQNSGFTRNKQVTGVLG